MFIVLTVGEDKVRVSVDKMISYKEHTDYTNKAAKCVVRLLGTDQLYVTETSKEIDDLLRESYVFVKGRS
jgi:hypothetical protein